MPLGIMPDATQSQCAPRKLNSRMRVHIRGCSGGAYTLDEKEDICLKTWYGLDTRLLGQVHLPILTPSQTKDPGHEVG
jgi:hypothetical protein